MHLNRVLFILAIFITLSSTAKSWTPNDKIPLDYTIDFSYKFGVSSSSESTIILKVRPLDRRVQIRNGTTFELSPGQKLEIVLKILEFKNISSKHPVLHIDIFEQKGNKLIAQLLGKLNEDSLITFSDIKNDNYSIEEASKGATTEVVIEPKLPTQNIQKKFDVDKYYKPSESSNRFAHIVEVFYAGTKKEGDSELLVEINSLNPNVKINKNKARIKPLTKHRFNVNFPLREVYDPSIKVLEVNVYDASTSEKLGTSNGNIETTGGIFSINFSDFKDAKISKSEEFKRGGNFITLHYSSK